ncbi:lytic transglycosylase domain-containing protein [Mobilitalea sibirica]|uniref:Lytic transglycosylase domain-containing protein n=1 Tax=Mobilitalea sibirica TaxID=1462919 RepID=A0A8J7GYJ2_9FIRM|nr:lytic transglycosylase domain-containing protein [Mobilitalea sibirica]MBH1940584.1 lytic transglycosylase domain-containing protein [Mobilitalea sibirica]
MSEVNAVSNIEQKNSYGTNAVKVKGNNNPDFSSYMKETKSLDDIFEEAAKKYNVSVNLLKAIGKAESDFRPEAVSRSGAQGIMQLMPKTAAYLGVKDSFDPEQNIMGGAKYIKELLDKYDGDTNLALAAYNAGMGNVRKYGGIPPFEETQNYVVKVNKFMKQELNTGNVTVTKSTPMVTAPTINYTYQPVKAAPIVSNQDVSVLVESIFSYEDYLKFLDILLDMDTDKENEEAKEN